MPGYSGRASFEFEIERYKNRETGKLLTHREVPDSDDDFEYEYQVITLKVEGSSYFSPGRTYGPPENCYPDEGDTEIESIVGPDGKDWSDQISCEERDSILEMIQDKSADSCDDYEPEYEPDDYDY